MQEFCRFLGLYLNIVSKFKCKANKNMKTLLSLNG